jgi:hydrogenase maturation protease
MVNSWMKPCVEHKGSEEELVLIIGYGSVLRADDALGQIVADYLSQYYQNEPRVKVRAVHQLTLDLADDVSKYDLVILIDAYNQSGSQGQLTFEAVYPSTNIPSPLTHYLQPGELLATTQTLFGKLPQMMLIGLTTDHFNHGEDFSNQAAANLSQVFRLVNDLVRSAL